jgi:anti-sigma regulatory factor (Ser/Thr protein kinase)
MAECTTCQGFSLEELRHAAINSPAGDLLSHVSVRDARGLRPGGLGLLLAKKLVDELIYNEKAMTYCSSNTSIRITRKLSRRQIHNYWNAFW